MIDKLTNIVNQSQESTMNTACSPCATSPATPLTTPRAVSNWTATARAWWTRWKAARQARRAICELSTLDGLNAEILKDIGAPEWMYERALRIETRARQGGLFERDSMHWR
jgi:hypothetical protein